eukprot:1192292-Prorocentrum_minimum.AAC.2
MLPSVLMRLRAIFATFWFLSVGASYRWFWFSFSTQRPRASRRERRERRAVTDGEAGGPR